MAWALMWCKVPTCKNKDEHAHKKIAMGGCLDDIDQSIKQLKASSYY